MGRISAVLCLLLLATAPSALVQERRNSTSRNNSTYFISGAVVLDDGTPLAESAEVILVCSGVVRQRVYTQAGSGQFSIALGESRSPETDITETATDPRGGGFKSFNQIGRGFGDDGRWGTGRATNVSRLYLGDCELTASLPGYASEVIYPGNRDLLDNPDVGVIRLSRKAAARGGTVSVKSLAAPEKARNAYDKARQELAREIPARAKAVRELEKAVGIYPEFAEAWFFLAQCYLAAKETARAREAFEKANRVDPDYHLPALALAELSLVGGDARSAAAWAGRVLERNPKVVLALYIHGFASFLLGNAGAAEASMLKVRGSQEASSFPGTYYVIGSIRASQGDIRSAAAELRRFLELNPGYEKAAEIRKQLVDWTENGLPAGSPAPLPQ